MDEMQLVVRLLENLGEDAKIAFIAWLIAKYGSLVACLAMLCVVAVYMFNRIPKE